MAEQPAIVLANAATVLATAKGKLEESKKELISVQKRIAKREGEVALAQKAYDDAFKNATK